MKRTNTVTALLFILLTLLMIGQLFWHGDAAISALRKPLQEQQTLLGKVDAITEKGEGAANAALDENHLFVQLFGGIQRLFGKRYVEDTAGMPVARLSTGALTFAAIQTYIDPTKNAAAVKTLSDALAQDNIPLLMAVAPGKLEAGADQMPYGLADYGNEICDSFLASLRAKGVDTLDLRTSFPAGDDYAALYFVTDHHWKPEGAFMACQQLMSELNARYGLPMQTQWLSEDAFTVETVEQCFLGSQGKRVGTLYAGMDDLSIYTPKGETNFRYEISDRKLTREGSFNEALCFPERLDEKDPFSANPYTYYSGGDWGSARITNSDVPDGPKIALIRESFACALTPFLALQCSELLTYDMRYFKGDLIKTLREEQPDLVIILYAAPSTRSENMFRWKN